MGKKITVQLKNSPIQITYSPKDIEPIINADEDPVRKSVQIKINKKEIVNPELDIRGLTVNEAIPRNKKNF